MVFCYSDCWCTVATAVLTCFTRYQYHVLSWPAVPGTIGGARAGVDRAGTCSGMAPGPGTVPVPGTTMTRATKKEKRYSSFRAKTRGYYPGIPWARRRCFALIPDRLNEHVIIACHHMSRSAAIAVPWMRFETVAKACKRRKKQ